MRAVGGKCLRCALRLHPPVAFLETPWSKSTLLRISNYRDPGHMTRNILIQTMIALALAAGASAFAQQAEPAYDLLLRGGHLLDDKNHIDGVMDVAIKDGKIAKVAAHIPPTSALKTVDVKGLYVTPGLIDIHVHVYAGTGERGSYAGDNSVYPDPLTLRVGVTTVADAGCAGWRNFEEFNDKIISRSKTRVLAFLNIVGSGMRGGRFENNLEDMQSAPAAEMAKKHRDVIVGFKTA